MASNYQVKYQQYKAEAQAARIEALHAMCTQDFDALTAAWNRLNNATSEWIRLTDLIDTVEAGRIAFAHTNARN